MHADISHENVPSPGVNFCPGNLYGHIFDLDVRIVAGNFLCLEVDVQRRQEGIRLFLHGQAGNMEFQGS